MACGPVFQGDDGAGDAGRAIAEEVVAGGGEISVFQDLESELVAVAGVVEAKVELVGMAETLTRSTNQSVSVACPECVHCGREVGEQKNPT